MHGISDAHASLSLIKRIEIKEINFKQLYLC